MITYPPARLAAPIFPPADDFIAFGLAILEIIEKIAISQANRKVFVVIRKF